LYKKLKKTANCNKKLIKCNNNNVIAPAQRSSKITYTSPVFWFIVPMMLGFRISNNLNKKRPTMRLNQSNEINGEQKTNQTPTTSSITMMGLSDPFSFSTTLIEGKEKTLTKITAASRMNQRQSSGRKSIGINATIEVKVPGNFGK